MRHDSLLLTALLFFSGCSGHGLQDWADETFNNKPAAEAQTRDTPDQATVAPSRNAALQSVSPSQTASSEGDGAMQKKLDTWVEKEWTPAVEANGSIKEMNADKDRPFTLQGYVDKASVYIKNQPESDEPTHYEKMEKLPVIGR